MINHAKWDIVDDIVSYEPVSTETEKAGRIRARVAKVATSAAFGAVVLANAIVLTSKPATLQVASYGASKPVRLSERWDFARPRGNRAAAAAMPVDTHVGMSTRRLGELHRTLFKQDTSLPEELTGDYNFL